jgi:cytochrome c oxidase subunit 4
MENAELLLGIPLLLFGAFGLFIAFSLFAIPEEDAAGQRAVVHPGAHPEPSQYVVIGLLLAFITLVEVGLYYVDDLSFESMVAILLVLSALKFMLVVGFFMHLRFDNKIFSVLFFGGLILAIAVFAVAIATLDGTLY